MKYTTSVGRILQDTSIIRTTYQKRQNLNPPHSPPQKHRHQLHRAGGGVMPKLMYGENWGEGLGGGTWDLDVINER